jgi:thymidylate synthase ThyX
MNGKTDAFLVWDGGPEVRVPPAMGTPRSDQLQGTVREQLAELCGRVCYDSLGRTGRDSAKYHAHIREVGHYSTIEAAAFTVEFPGLEMADQVEALVNRPCLFVRDGMNGLRVTCNLRHAVEADVDEHLLWQDIANVASDIAPHIVRGWSTETSNFSLRVVEPETDEEKWVSLFLTMSRGASHELVRHGDWTAISQRSTRYVNESESPWVRHPLIDVFLREKGDAWGSTDVTDPRFLMQHTYGSARSTYDRLVPQLQEWLLARGVDKTSARKQARGAARGFLGNALETQVIFSASVAQWRHMLRMRASDAADAEIREVFCKALACLKASRYGDRFADMELVPASDGIGQSLRGGGAK